MGEAINLHVTAGSCVNTMKVYIDDVEVQTIAGNVSPVPPSTTNWIGGYSEGTTHRLVVVGFANDAGTASTTIHSPAPSARGVVGACVCRRYACDTRRRLRRNRLDDGLEVHRLDQMRLDAGGRAAGALAGLRPGR